MELDIDPIIEESTLKFNSEGIDASLKYLHIYERQSRNLEDGVNSSKIILHIISLCVKNGDWDLVSRQIVTLVNKRSQSKQAIIDLVRRCVELVQIQKTEQSRLKLINTLLDVTKGKVYLEVERARLTKMLVKSKEEEGKLHEAAELLFELQIETYGSMDMKERWILLLDQMRLGLLIQDYVRVAIASKRMYSKYLEDPALEECKIQFYSMLIRLSIQNGEYLDCARHYFKIYSTPSVSANHEMRLETFKGMILFCSISQYTNEQSDMMYRLFNNEDIISLPVFKAFLKYFMTNELINYQLILDGCLKHFQALDIFSTFEGSQLDISKIILDKILEHNIRVIEKYYKKIRFSRLTELLKVDPQMAEEALTKLVISKTIYARIDRPHGMIDFIKKKSVEEIMDDWSHNHEKILNTLVKTNHLINKEEFLH